MHDFDSVIAQRPGDLPRPTFNPEWLARLHACADQPPLLLRVALVVGEQVIGSVVPDLINKIGLKPPWNINSLLLKEELHGQTVYRVNTPLFAAPNAPDDGLTTTLNQIAHALRDAGVGRVAHHWRGEQLAVYSDSGERLGSVERAAVRPLGIATRAVHLVGRAPDGRMWVQQRSLAKSNDPGLWDTLMGGMLPWGDSLHAALARETWEEAGLHVAALHAVTHGGRTAVRGPARDELAGEGIGYVMEETDWFHCTVPDRLAPVNQDGEVAQFALLEPDELVAWLHAGKFTPDAALVLVVALGASLG